MIPDEANRLANKLAAGVRDKDDANAAFMLRLLTRVYEVSKELLDSTTPEQAGLAYDELVDLIQGQPDR
jgi:hypothetical protein